MSRDTVLKLLSFTVGVAIGSAVTLKFVKDKYEKYAQEEIDSVKEEYAKLTRSLKEKLTEDNADVEEDDEYYPDDDEREFTQKEIDTIEYYKLTTKYKHSEINTDEEGGNGDADDEVPYINGPYVITADEFNSSPPGYNVQPLDYFADGVLADSWGVPLDIEETIGEDSLECFGEDFNDILYVRNERNEIDYEVTRDPRTYEEVVRTNPDPYYGR